MRLPIATLDRLALRGFRRYKRWTLHDLSEHAGISLSFLYKLEAGAAQPRRGTLYKLARALEVNPEDLLHQELDSHG